MSAYGHRTDGVGHYTYLTPLILRVYAGQQWGWAVEGSPADCVKIATSEPRPASRSGCQRDQWRLERGDQRPVFGTVAAAIGRFYGITAWPSPGIQYTRGSTGQRGLPCRSSSRFFRAGASPQLYNTNIPTAATFRDAEIRVVPMDVTLYGRSRGRTDPFGRVYYWATAIRRPP